jgi:hypothetical protein
MEKFDIGLAYIWEYDKDFINLIEQHLQANGLTTFIIGEHNLYEVGQRVAERSLGFRIYLDRAWDVDDNFGELGKMVVRRKTIMLNQYKRVHHAIDKATMHLELITGGINVPYSIIIPPKSYSENIYLSLNDLACLGRPFIIKPCNTTGGGTGVVTGAESLEEILYERKNYGDDKYILQEKIYPAIFGSRRAWFRCFWAFGKPIPVWWDDQTHLYTLLTEDDIRHYNLKKLFPITKTIARLTGLDFFSTEIVLSADGQFVAIDYVNDQCDMRLQSRHFDGAPDVVVMQIIESLKKYIFRLKRTKQID